MSPKVVKMGHFWLIFLSLFSEMADQFALIPFAWYQASPGTSLEYPQVALWCRLTMAIFRPFLGHVRPFWWKISFFCPILMYEIDFYIQEESKNTLGSNGKKFSEGGLPREKIIQKWPNFHHFWNCGHIMPKHKMKIDMDNISFCWLTSTEHSISGGEK